MSKLLKKTLKKLDRICENKTHDDEEIFDNVFQCKRCFRVRESK